MGLGEYHVVAGRIEREGRLGGCLAWVAQHPMCDAEVFMKAALEDNGWTRTSRVRVLADGADGLSNVVNTAAEETTHRVLDWFHISMRLPANSEDVAGGSRRLSGISCEGGEIQQPDRSLRVRCV
jgi:hypothetical protein